MISWHWLPCPYQQGDFYAEMSYTDRAETLAQQFEMIDMCSALSAKLVSLLLLTRQFNNRKLLIVIKTDCCVEMVGFSNGI